MAKKNDSEEIEILRRVAVAAVAYVDHREAIVDRLPFAQALDAAVSELKIYRSKEGTKDEV